MRKQDRIAQEQQNQSQDSSRKDAQTQPREREQMRGSASDQKPTRHPGDKLPLPK